MTDNAQPVREKTGNQHAGREYFLLRNSRPLQTDAEHCLLELLVSLEDQDIHPSREFLAYRLDWTIHKLKHVTFSLHRKGVIHFEGATNKRRIVINWDYIEANLQKPWREFKDANSAHTGAELNSNSDHTGAELNPNSAQKSEQLGSYRSRTRRISDMHIKEKGFKGYPPKSPADRGGLARKDARTSKAKSNGNGGGVLSNEAIQSLGLKYDIQAQAGESWDSFRARVLSEDRRRNDD